MIEIAEDITKAIDADELRHPVVEPAMAIVTEIVRVTNRQDTTTKAEAVAREETDPLTMVGHQVEK